MKKVLFVLTSHEDLGNTGEKTGFWIEEFAAPYYMLKEEGIEITLASMGRYVNASELASLIFAF